MDNSTGGGYTAGNSNSTGGGNTAGNSNSTGGGNTAGGSNAVPANNAGAAPTEPIHQQLLNERAYFTYGGVTTNEEPIRRAVLAAGTYNPAVPQQPYAKNLAIRFEAAVVDDGSRQMPITLPPRDREYLDIMHRAFRDAEYGGYDVPFFFINQVVFAFAIFVILLYVFSKYILPGFLRLFATRVFISKL
ncbi:hypothetical protein CDL12_30443 [Handroanthus impetiginosus]|uniref:ATP synthase protein 8 n=1 Tax=Handroanthus impetiginosus TaxID=429701 RepID=A0A2G9FVH4_9LAMI|nr:hypothetical protein CDL12_30443 [Handroanthus impetiginosus]